MVGDTNYSMLIRQAQQGERRALNELARLVKPRLLQYIQRLTLDEHLAQDLLQESLITMVRELQNLREIERFWPWLTRIALNKVRAHYRSAWRKKDASLPEPLEAGSATEVKDALGEVIGREVRQIVISAMHHLSPEHRAVLAMRCYDELSYPQMAEQLGCGEFRVRTLFARAKRALGKNLARNGLGRGSLLGALVIFGKMSATSETAVADVAIAETMLSVGLGPALVALVTSKALLTTAALVTVVATPTAVLTLGSSGPPLVEAVRTMTPSEDQHIRYYYPAGQPDAVLIQTRRRYADTDWAWQWLQNPHANYSCSRERVRMVNAHLWQTDLSVMRLPTDSPSLRNFLDHQEGRSSDMAAVRWQPGGFLVTQGWDTRGPFQRVLEHYDIADEEAFNHPWPAGTPIEDLRDSLHQQGWAVFEISGELWHQSVSGLGQLPLVLAERSDHEPWLTITLGEELRLEDHSGRAFVSDGDGKVLARYHAGSFFRGLSRPWTGLHTIDTVRRDAAAAQLPFTTRRLPSHALVEVAVTDGDIELLYTIDLKQDLVQAIALSRRQEPIGSLRFHYRTDLPADVTAPALGRSATTRPHKRSGLSGLWLSHLAKKTWDTD